VCERQDANCTREAGHLDEIQGVVASALNGAGGKRCDLDGQAEGRMSGSERVNLPRNGAVDFIDWLDRFDSPNDYEEADQSSRDDPTRNHVWRVARFRTSLREVNHETEG